MKIFAIILIAFTYISSFGQNNVGIGTLTPNPQAILEVNSNDKGVLISRLTTLARNTLGTALTALEDGMLVYDKDMTTFFYWDGPNLQWVQVGSGTGDDWGAQTVQTSGTNISGNGTTGNPLIVTDADSDPNNEIELPTGGVNGQVISTDGNGNYSWIDDNNGTDNQDLTLTGNTLSLTNDVTTVDLSTLKDHDWYEVGGTTQPDAITDNIFTQGKVGISGTSPVTFLDVLDLSTDTLKSVLARLPEGNNSGKGSYLGVFSHGTQPANIRSFSIQHRFYDTVNTSINFLRGATHYDGEISFGTKRNIERMRIDVNGNVGIGTPLPSDRLHIEGNQYMHHTDQSQIHLASENNTSNHSANIRMSNLTSNNGWLITQGHLNSDDNFTIQSYDVSNNYTHRFYINHTNGDVGINTNAPTAQLDVNGDLRVRNIPVGTTTEDILVTDVNGNIRKIPNFQFNSSTNGFSILPSGMIMQWGTITNVPLNQTFNTVTFPMAFPGACRNVQATIHRGSAISGTVATVVRNVSTTGCQIAGDHDTNTSTGNIHWFAIGF